MTLSCVARGMKQQKRLKDRSRWVKIEIGRSGEGSRGLGVRKGTRKSAKRSLGTHALGYTGAWHGSDIQEVGGRVGGRRDKTRV
eukprot:6210036-Pleurochrysis_carterae.AAC.1